MMKIRKAITCLFVVLCLTGCVPVTVAESANATESTEAANEVSVAQSTSIAGTTSALVATGFTAATLTATTEAANIATAQPTSTATTPSQPVVDVKLSGDNNAEMVYEENSWVVKNSNGDVTATWTGSEWTYNMDVITISQTIIGFDGQDATLLDTLLASKPEDTVEMHFINPISGEPLAYGYMREDTIMGTSTEDVTFEIPVSMFAVRMLGTVAVTATDNALVLEMPLTADRIILFVMDENSMQGVLLYGLSDENLAQETTLMELPAVLFTSTAEFDLFNNDLRGQQMLMGIYHDVPESLSLTYEQWNINTQCQELLTFIDDPTAAVPAINVFDSDLVMSPYWNAALWVPIEVEQALQESVQ